MLDYLTLLGLDKSLPEGFADAFGNATMLVSVALVSFAMAFFGYRLFKALFPVMFAATLASVAFTYAPDLISTIGLEVEFLDLTATAAVVLALLGLILGRYAYKLSIFLFVGWYGYSAGVGVCKALAEQNAGEFFGTPTGELVIGLAVAVIAAIHSIFLFKALYIFISSIGGMAICATCLVDAVMVEMPAWFIVVPVGAVIGIFAIVKQVKDNSVYSTRRYR